MQAKSIKEIDENTSSAITELNNKPQGPQDENIIPGEYREGRGSPSASIGAYITNYWEKKKRRTMKYKTKRPANRPYYHKRHKHCYYDYY